MGILIPFQKIKDYLIGFSDSKEGKRDKYSNIVNEKEQLDFETILSYKDIYEHKNIFTLILHQKFVSDYHSLFIANLLIEKNICPEQYKNMFDYLSGEIKLKSLSESDKNVKLLGERC